MASMRTPEEKMELIVRRTKENDATASRARIMNAFKTAERLHDGIMRKDGVTPYIDHPVSVAEIVADNGGDQTMVIAALLHDTVEDTSYTLQSLAVTFGKDVADIVDAVTKVEASIPDDIVDDHQRRLIKNYVDGLSNAKLLDSSNPQSGKAIYIKLADRLHNMKTLGACSKKSQSRKATDTLQFFVPLARLIGSKYFERELSELCFEVLQPDLYYEISAAYEETRSRNSRHIESFMKMFDLALRKTHSTESAVFRKISNGPFKCYQIRNLLGVEARPFSSMGSFSKSAIYLYEIVLEYQGLKQKMLSDFIDIYQSDIKPNRVSLKLELDYPSPSVVAIDLADRLSNHYLVLLRPYQHYHHVSDYASLFPPDTSLLEMPEKFITVYSKDGDPFQVEEGSTVLDFAFRIHPDLGCSALYAIIRRGNSPFEIAHDESFAEVILASPDDVECVISHPLQDGDHVLIVADSDQYGEPIYHVSYDWFAYAKTQYATSHLVEFLNKMAPIESSYQGHIAWDPALSKRFKKS